MSKQTNPLWEDDSIQFPRLLSEIYSNVNFIDRDWQDLCDSMDLDSEDVIELLERAHAEWERIKAR